MRRRSSGWLASALPLVLWSATAAQEPTLLSDRSSGLLELESERRLEISGLHGTLAVRLGKPRELRFAARQIGGAESEAPVGLWLDGQVLRLGPLEGSAGGPLRVEVSIGPELGLGLETTESEVQLVSLHGAIAVRGARIRLTARSIDGSLDLDLAESSAVVSGVAAGLELEGRGLNARIDNVDGPLSLALSAKSEVHLSTIRGEVEGEVDGSELTLSGVTGPLRLGVSQGPLSVDSCTGGGELRLEGVPLDMRANSGAFQVETDAEVRFQGHDGPLTIKGRGAPVRGSLAKGGALEIETDGAEVRLEQVESAVGIRGFDLEVSVTDCKGELTIKTSYTTIVVDKCENPVIVENDFGDIEIRGASKLVRVASRDGDVTLHDFKGSAEVKAEGPIVQIDWVGFDGVESSTVENSRGDVRVTLPMTLRCQVDAQAPFGRVETDIDELTLSEDGRSASGQLRGGGGPAPYVKRPSLRLKSNGDLYVHAGAPAAGGGP